MSTAFTHPARLVVKLKSGSARKTVKIEDMFPNPRKKDVEGLLKSLVDLSGGAVESAELINAERLA